MSATVTFEDLIKRMHHQYQRQTRGLLRVEKKQLEKPTTEQAEEITETKGYIKGLRYAIGLIEEARNTNELPLDQEVSA